MNKQGLLSSPDYWLTYFQTALYNVVDAYMREHFIDKTEFAQQCGLSMNKLRSIMRGDADLKMSELIKLCIDIDIMPNDFFKKLST